MNESSNNLTGIPETHARAVEAVATFGTTVVREGADLARYVGRVLGTVPEDAVGLVLGHPLHFVRTVVAAQLDCWLDKILTRRDVKETQPVSPSLAIPLLTAAYDESSTELQELLAGLMAAAMDPARSSRVRLSFIDALKKFDPLDALVLRERDRVPGELRPSAVECLAQRMDVAQSEVDLSVDNLENLKCVFRAPAVRLQFYPSLYGNALLRACLD